MINHGKRIELMKAWYNSSILDIGQAANVYSELWACVYTGEREAGPLNVPVSQTETFTDLAETKPRIHFPVQHSLP
jgi:hypothetical protein